MIVLTGATGGLGSSVFKHILKLVPPSEIIVSLYNPKGASEALTSPGVEIREGNYKDPASLDRAFQGADKLLIVSYPSIAHKERADAHANAIDAAKRAGVKHVFYTSLAFAGDSITAVMQAHIDTEAYLKKSGLTYTIIREGLYTESFPLYFGFWNPSGEETEIVVPGDGGISWVARDDLGEATARIIVSGSYPNSTILFSGSRAYTLKETTELVASLSGRPLKFGTCSKEEFVKRHEDKGNVGRAWATTYEGLERGEAATVDPLLQEILERPLIPVEVTIKTRLGIEA